MEKKCGYICYFLALLFLFVIFLIVSNDADIRSWTEARQGMAGWAQFIGAILAICGTAIFVQMQIQADHGREEKKIKYDIERRLKTLDAVLEDEIFLIERILKKYDEFFDKKYRPLETRGFYKPRPLNPPNLENILKDSYIDLSAGRRNALKVIIFYVPTLNNYVEEMFDHIRKEDLNKERHSVWKFMYTGTLYYYYLRGVLRGDDLPTHSNDDESILRKLHSELGFTTDIEYFLSGHWRWEKYPKRYLALDEVVVK